MEEDFGKPFDSLTLKFKAINLRFCFTSLVISHFQTRVQDITEYNKFLGSLVNEYRTGRKSVGELYREVLFIVLQNGNTHVNIIFTFHHEYN